MVPLSRVLLLITYCSPSEFIIYTWTIPGLNNAPDVKPFQPGTVLRIPFRLFPFRSPLLRECCACARCFIFLRLLRCFTSAGMLSHCCELFRITEIEFPHSEITGSKVASHLPDAYRRHATSFIALISQGIRHSLITYPSIYSSFEYIDGIFFAPRPFCEAKSCVSF